MAIKAFLTLPIFRLGVLFLAVLVSGVWVLPKVAKAEDTSSSFGLQGGSSVSSPERQLSQASRREASRREASRQGTAASEPSERSLGGKELTEEEILEQEAADPTVWPEPMEVKLKEIFPEDVVAMSLIDEGKRLIAKGDYGEAVERFERAVAMSPSQPRGYYFLARASFLQRQYRQALAFLKKAELLFGSNPEWQGEVCALRGATYEEVGDQAKARLAYECALRFTPQNLSALSGLTRLPEEEEPKDESPNP